MTRDEADNMAKNMSYRQAVYNAFAGRGVPYRKATKKKLLELLDMLESHPCEDSVSRESVRDGMLKYGFNAPDMTVAEFVEDELRPVTPTRANGVWIGIDDYPHDVWECDRCGGLVYSTIAPYEEYKFCPNCGAKMEGVEE